MWEKCYERLPQTQQDAPFAVDETNDSLEQNPEFEDHDDHDSDPDVSPPITTDSPTLIKHAESKPWINQTTQGHLRIIVKDDKDINQNKRSLKEHFSRQGLKWKDEEEEVRPWYFGLTSIRLQFA